MRNNPLARNGQSIEFFFCVDDRELAASTFNHSSTGRHIPAFNRVEILDTGQSGYRMRWSTFALFFGLVSWIITGGLSTTTPVEQQTLTRLSPQPTPPTAHFSTSEVYAFVGQQFSVPAQRAKTLARTFTAGLWSDRTIVSTPPVMETPKPQQAKPTPPPLPAKKKIIPIVPTPQPPVVRQPNLKSKAPAQEPAFVEEAPTIFEQTLQLARYERKKVLLKFSAPWCMPCKLMDKTVLNDPDVLRQLRTDYLLLDINIEDFDGYNLKEQYGVDQLPTLIIVDTNQQVLKRNNGALKRSDFLDFIRAY